MKEGAIDQQRHPHHTDLPALACLLRVAGPRALPLVFPRLGRPDL
jgi:hypothetical protein